MIFVAPPIGAYHRGQNNAPERIRSAETEELERLCREARKMYKTKPESVERLLEELKSDGYIYEEYFDSCYLEMIITVEKDGVKALIHIPYSRYIDTMALKYCIRQCVKKVDAGILKGENK